MISLKQHEYRCSTLYLDIESISEEVMLQFQDLKYLYKYLRLESFGKNQNLSLLPRIVKYYPFKRSTCDVFIIEKSLKEMVETFFSLPI